MQTDTDRLIGTWALVSQHTHTPDGRCTAPRGEYPIGLLIYDALGNMSVQLARTDDHLPHTNLTEFETAMAVYHGYFGRYTVDESHQQVTHHVLGSAYPNYRGTQQVRHYQLAGDQLTLTVYAADDTRRVMVWQRLNGPISPPAL